MTTSMILSFDPGGTTGYARYYLRDIDARYNSRDPIGWTGGQLGPGNHHKQLWELLTREHPDWIVCERFDYEPGHDKVELISCNYIGVIELYCELTNTKLYMQPRSCKDMAWLTVPKLKILRVYKPGQPHRNDATRHLIWHLVQTLKRKEILNGLKR